MQIPVSGLPITLTRTYDSRDASPGDFGIGWKLDVSSIRLQQTGVMGEGWRADHLSLYQDYVHESTAHLITITFPGGRVYQFVPQLYLNYQVGNSTIRGELRAAAYNITFSSLSGTQGSLVALNPPDGLDIEYPEDAFPVPVTFYGNRSDLEDEFQHVFDPREFLFTTLDGRQFQFDADGKVVKMTDRNGNSLTFGRNGITHSSGKGIQFIRDNAGRITGIYDPNGLDAGGQPSGPPVLLYKYDDLGNLIQVHRLTDRPSAAYLSTSFLYENPNFPHYFTAIQDPRGVTGIRNEYGDDGRLISNIDADGKKIMYVHDLSGRTEIIVDRLGNTNRLMYDTKGNVTQSVNALNQTNFLAYDSNNNKISSADPLGHITGYQYDGNNLLLTVTNALQQVTRFTYDQAGRLLTGIDPLGHGATNRFDVLGNLTNLVDALGNFTSFLYDSGGKPVSQRDVLGNIVTNRYDQFGNLTNTIRLDNQGSTLSSVGYSYDANGNRTNQTVWWGINLPIITTYLYDAQNRIVTTIDPAGNTTQVVYDDNGRQAETVDALGRATYFDYDLKGNLTSTRFSDGSSESSTFDAENRRNSTVNRLGLATQYVFDPVGRLIATIFSDNTTNSTVFDSAGRVAKTIDALGTLTAFGYDAAGRRTSVTNALGTTVQAVARFEFDAAGNQTTMVDALNHTNTYLYDALNRRTDVIVQDGTRQTTRYDGLNRRIAETDQGNLTTWFAFDGLGRLVFVTNALSQITAYGYDEVGNQISQTDARTNTTRFLFDGLSRRIQRQLPGGQSENFRYDAVGNVLAHTNFNGLVLTNLYDSMNRLASTWSGSTQLVSYGYSLLGQRTSMTDPSGTYSYVYDNRGRLLTNSTPAGRLSYTYDANGNLTAIQSSTPNGTLITYQYDAVNRLTNIIDGRLSGTPSSNTACRYDVAGNLQSLSYPNGVTNVYQYDSLNRLTDLAWKLNSTTLASFDYKLGPAGNRTNLVENLNGSMRTNSWAYDMLYRLTNETVAGASPTGTLGYSYDQVGNRTNRSGSLGLLGPVTYSYGSNDWLSADAYDKNGNTRTNNSAVCLYDWANRLTNYVNGSTNVSIIYNADGQRVSKTAGGATTLYLFDDRNPTRYAQVLEELSVSGGTTNLTRGYTYGLELISQRQIAPALISFYGVDGLGSTRFLAGTNGAISDTYVYDSYGTMLTNTGTTTNLYLFAGEQFDPHLRLYLNRARYLNPSTGRFWTMDTFQGNLADPLSLHKYLYAHANPANGRDRSGHEFTVLGVSIATTISQSQQAIYDGVVSGVGAALQASIFGVNAGQTANEILTDFVLDETGISLVLGAYSYLKDALTEGGYDESDADAVTEEAWEEEVIYAIALAIPGEQAEAYEIEFVPQCFVAGTLVLAETAFEPHTPTIAPVMPKVLTLEQLLGYERFSKGSKARLHQTEHPNALPASWRCPG